ncbi:MAG: hypothetical protein WD079_03365, partial [Phycisphaeraceae bacterium]
QGGDAAAGTTEAPLRTLQAAQKRVRHHLAEQQETSVAVILHEGTYRLTEPLQFTPADTPAQGHTVTWRAADGAEVRISGGRVITGWQRQNDGSFTTTLPDAAAGEWTFRELFVNGERRNRARYPSTGFAQVNQVGEDRRTNFTFHPEDVPEQLAGDLSASQVELVFFHDWSSSRTPVKMIDREQNRLHTAAPVGPSLGFFHMDNWEAHPRYYLENHPALLTAPGEWYLDPESGTLTYLPQEGETIDNIQAVAPVATGLVHVRGEADDPVQGLIFRGLHFEHANWQPPADGYAGVQASMHDRGDDTGWHFVPAAISFEHAEHCAIEVSSVRRLGQSAIWVGSRCSNNRIAGNVIDDVAGNGIMI